MNFLSGANTTPSDLDSTTNREAREFGRPAVEPRGHSLSAAHYDELRRKLLQEAQRFRNLPRLPQGRDENHSPYVDYVVTVTFFKLFLVIIIPMFNDFNSKCLPELTLEAFNKIHHLLHSFFHTLILRSETRLFSVHFF